MSNTQDPIKLLDEYAEARHVHGDYTYNAVTKAARDRAIAALQPAPQPPGFDAHDMATAAADGFRDGVASVQPPGDAREAFEAFYKDSSVPFWKEPNGEYVYYKSEWIAFQAGAAWQAAQASEPSAEQLLDAIRHAGFTAVKNTHGVHLMKLGEVTAYAAPARAVEPLLENMPKSWELSWGSDDEERPGEWRVHARQGSRNDREWVFLGAGPTPSAAIKKAHGITTPAAKEQS